MNRSHDASYRILDLARWAPSGDNAQPWRFAVLSEREIDVHIRRPAPDNPYEYHGGQPTWLAVGGLLESIRIAATHWGHAASWRRNDDDGDSIRVTLSPERDEVEDPRFPFLTTRSVDRTAYRLRALTAWHRARVEKAIDGELVARWYPSVRARAKWALINARATDIRLTIPEAYRVHRCTLDWKSDHSSTGIPVGTIGLDAGTRTLMRWVMKDWSRVRNFNRYLAGTVIPRVELDLLPGIRCSAFFTLTAHPSISRSAPKDLWLAAGAAFQRFWLEATSMGLVVQPTLAPLAFATYGLEKTPFTVSQVALRQCERLAAQLAAQLEDEGLDELLLLGRIGFPRHWPAKARSTRRPLEHLIHSDERLPGRSSSGRVQAR